MIFLAAAIVVACVAALAFYPALRLRGPVRTLAWAACTAVVAVSPCLIPMSSPGLRQVASMVAISLLVKLYDSFNSGDLARERGFLHYAAWLPNPCWLVLRRVPPPVPREQDWRRVPRGLLSFTLALALLYFVLAFDWPCGPLVLEHCVKVIALYAVVVSFAEVGTVALRLLGCVALDPMNSPAFAVTPGEFWRRWNRPAQQYFAEYAFRPAGGLHHPVRATLLTFAASGLIHEYVFGIAAGRLQGWQVLFFLTQGIAVAATMHLRPTGWQRRVAFALTLLFNLATSLLFFQSVIQVIPFYSSRPPHAT